jgi:hypothetical protein
LDIYHKIIKIVHIAKLVVLTVFLFIIIFDILVCSLCVFLCPRFPGARFWHCILQNTFYYLRNMLDCLYPNTQGFRRQHGVQARLVYKFTIFCEETDPKQFRFCKSPMGKQNKVSPKFLIINFVYKSLLSTSVLTYVASSCIMCLLCDIFVLLLFVRKFMCLCLFSKKVKLKNTDYQLWTMRLNEIRLSMIL